MHQYISCYCSSRYDGCVKNSHEGEFTRAGVILKYCAYFDNAFILTTYCVCVYTVGRTGDSVMNFACAHLTIRVHRVI